MRNRKEQVFWRHVGWGLILATAAVPVLLPFLIPLIVRSYGLGGPMHGPMWILDAFFLVPAISGIFLILPRRRA